MFQTIFTVFIIGMTTYIATAGEAVHAAIKIWPDAAPGETGDIGPEHVQSKNPGLSDKVIRLTDVTEPTLTFYPASKDHLAATTVMICPGGGYGILAWNLEGTEIAAWLNQLGVDAVILKYRVPRRKDRPFYEAPLQDAQRAIRILRRDGKQHSVGVERIGVLGFSAGGHLSAVLSTHFNRDAYKPIDDTDQLSSRPDFTVLIYPAYIDVDKDVTKTSPEITVTDKTPPAFVTQTEDDRFFYSSIAYTLALKKHKVPVDLHIFAKGGHGYGLRGKGPVATWPVRCADWMRANGWIQ